MQAVIDQTNAEFWNELCGTTLAQACGVRSNEPEDLQKFDQAYFDIYPYLLPLVKPEWLAGRRVLEIGLGYGSLSQKLAEAGAEYHGLDIAPNAAKMVNHRLAITGHTGKAVVGSALAMPFPDVYFDCVVSIGCFHHTGDVQQCFNETYRVLKPGGRAVLMVYNKYSWRQWRQWPKQTIKSILSDCYYGTREPEQLTAERRAQYDAHVDGAAAPETVLLSIQQLRVMLRKFAVVKFSKRNCDPLVFKRWHLDRKKLLPTLGRTLGLDIYITAIKDDSAEDAHLHAV